MSFQLPLRRFLNLRKGTQPVYWRFFWPDGWASLPDTARCKSLGVRYIALDEIIENPVEKDGGESHGKSLRNVLFDLWGILFRDHGRETYRRLEGDDMTPITAYKSGNRYYVADGGNSLTTARYLGQAFVLAQVWELP